MQIKAILFDKDGTLADFPATFNPATAHVIEHYAQDSDELRSEIAEVLKFDLLTGEIDNNSVIVAGSGRDVSKVLQPIIGFEDIEVFSTGLDKLYGEICMTTVVALPGIAEALARLKEAAFLLGVATNDSETNAIGQMQALGFDQSFSLILGADSGFGGKPGSGMINAFINHVNLRPENILMVGDSLHDLEAGRAAGVNTCGVLTGPATADELAPHADILMESVSQLPEYLIG